MMWSTYFSIMEYLMMRFLWMIVLALGVVSGETVLEIAERTYAADNPLKQLLWDDTKRFWKTQEWDRLIAVLEQLDTISPLPHERVALNSAFGVVFHEREDFDAALQYYEQALVGQPTNIYTLFNLAKLYYDRYELHQAIKHFQRLIEIDSRLEAQCSHMLALSYHHTQNYVLAEYYYRKSTEESAAYYFDFAVTLERLGKIKEANLYYNKALARDQSLASAWLNVAALHHQFGDVNMSIPSYHRVLNLSTATSHVRLMAMMNVGVAYELTNDIQQALYWMDQALQYLPQVSFHSNPIEQMNEVRTTQIALWVHQLRAKRTACIWEDYEFDWDRLLNEAEFEISRGRVCPLLPFDTLLYYIDPRHRRKIAELHSKQFASDRKQISLPPLVTESESPIPRLCVGYLSYDFTDHPTTHLMEGIFASTDTQRMRVLAFGYGRDDGSIYRRRVMTLVDKFLNIAELSNEHSADAIRAHKVHILMDAQGHTRGGRPLIVASRPAPIVVNYLVYPGTSGASYIDYMISDRYVTPAESLASQGFTEKLVLLPYSYQVNYYNESIHATWRSSSAYESSHNIDVASNNESSFLFVNFNKIDKLEPSVFATWMAILRRVPSSRLLLLDPNKAGSPATPTSMEIKYELTRQAASYGISSSRITFVPRVSKEEHLKRQARYGGLFLDTFVYGAHSTATDALYAGLPVVTLAGDAFASRVGISLLINADMHSLITYTRKEFEDLSVEIATKPQLYHKLKEQLLHPGKPLFQTRQHVATLEASQRAMFTIEQMRHHPFHVVVGDSHKTRRNKLSISF